MAHVVKTPGSRYDARARARKLHAPCVTYFAVRDSSRMHGRFEPVRCRCPIPSHVASTRADDGRSRDRRVDGVDDAAPRVTPRDAARRPSTRGTSVLGVP